MEDPTLQHQLIVARLLEQQSENITDTAVDHWAKLADEVISIIGEAGFNSLYERSLQLVQPDFPWITSDSAPLQTADNHRFADLGMRLADQAPADARAAHSQLLTTFTDMLASLIGEHLTSNILHVAWGNLFSATAGTEQVR